MFRKVSIALAVAGVLLAPVLASAATKKVHSTTHVTTHTRSAGASHVRSRTVSRTRVTHTRAGGSNVHVNIRVGGRYNGGVWYGARRHYWNGRWYAYGVGSCWLATPIGYVWTCG